MFANRSAKRGLKVLRKSSLSSQQSPAESLRLFFLFWSLGKSFHTKAICILAGSKYSIAVSQSGVRIEIRRGVTLQGNGELGSLASEGAKSTASTANPRDDKPLLDGNGAPVSNGAPAAQQVISRPLSVICPGPKLVHNNRA